MPIAKEGLEMNAVPYFAQWESRDMVAKFISGEANAAEDPLWQMSGASDPQEYANWSQHLCGMACLKMLLAHWQNKIVPTFELMRDCRDYGGYVVAADGMIKGLIYRPFVTFIAEKFALSAEVKEHTPLAEICELLGKGYVFFASVHPSIRTPEVTPPRQGGHLVYVFGWEEHRQELLFHNPSGHTMASQENVRLNRDTFARFYANRGILIKPVE
ncbi:C39 family peptidase [Brevibacillus fulvus]